MTEKVAGLEKNVQTLTDMIREEKILSFMQPIIDLYTGTVFGYEMLSRGEGPLVYPTEMFDKAREWNLYGNWNTAAEKRH